MSKKKHTPTLEEIFRGIDPPSEDGPVSGKIPKELQLERDEPGICFGKRSKKFPSHYVGVSQAAESNCIVIGGAGSNKTVGIAKTTLQTWKGAMVVTDIKGELSDYYKELYLNGLVDRPPLVFNPMDVEGISYDPFEIIEADGYENDLANIRSIANSIIPHDPNVPDPFWDDRERAILAAGLLYDCRISMSFSESMCWIANCTVFELCERMLHGNLSDPTIRMLLGNILDLKPETTASFDCGLRNKVLPFVTDLRVSNAFGGKRENKTYFTWDDLRKYNIFLKVPIKYVDLCKPIVNLLVSQLLQYLQNQPEKYSERGSAYPEILLLMDEFSSFEHIRGIADGVATLRSKRTHFCFLIQSIAQLDKVYGEYDRRIIFDNCQYKVILQACDPETQHFLADMIGTELHTQRSSSKQYDQYLDLRGYTKGKSSTREYAVQPYNLANLETKCILVSPYGVNELAKVRYLDMPQFSEYISDDYTGHFRKIAVRANEAAPGNIGCTALSLEERLESVRSKIAAAKTAAAAERESEAAKEDPMALEIGQRVLKYFPDLSVFQPGSEEENALRYKPLEAVLHALAGENEVLDRLREKSGYDHLMTDALSTQSSDM